MGQFNISITGVGGHGCQREIKNGEKVEGCGRDSCPDCNARRLVQKLQATGCSIETATLTHWPGQPSQVTDNLLTKVREGSF